MTRAMINREWADINESPLLRDIYDCYLPRIAPNAPMYLRREIERWTEGEEKQRAMERTGP